MSQFEILKTPNPSSLKFQFSLTLVETPHHFSSSLEAEDSPLASKLFGFPWVSEVTLGETFVTVSKQDWVDWEPIAEPLAQIIAEHIDSGLPLLLPKEASPEEDENDPPLVRNIKRVLHREIRPIVALDGGDVVFAKWSENKLYLHMRGACSGCPSRSITLKEGIETRMKELFPEVEEVIAL